MRADPVRVDEGEVVGGDGERDGNVGSAFGDVEGDIVTPSAAPILGARALVASSGHYAELDGVGSSSMVKLAALQE